MWHRNRTKALLAPEIVVRRERFAPFDLAAAQGQLDWRDALAWPLTVTPVRQAMERRYRAFLELTGTLAEEKRRIMILALGRILSNSSALLECAMLIEAEQETGLLVRGGPAELDWLRGKGQTPPLTPQRAGQNQPPVAFAALRRLARTASWTSWLRLPATVLAPEFEAVSHNSMLREAASGRRVRYIHGESVLEEARKNQPGNACDVRSLAEAATCVFTDGFEAVMGRRLQAIVMPKIAMHLERAAADLAALARTRRVPQNLWSGSAGSYAARALGLETIRRGGRAVRFDHGGSACMTDNIDSLTLRETCASTRFVATTEQAASLYRAAHTVRAIPGLPQAEIVGGAGDPHFRQALTIPTQPRRARPTVIYATGAIYGFRQIFPPVPRDTIYLDWQMRVAKTLLSLPANVLLKPHPEGIFRGIPHPLAAVGPVAKEPFESLMASADVFVFDFALSTTFWTALCSERPIVFVDLGLVEFNPEVRRMIEERCLVVPAFWNEDNIPQVDSAALEAAVFARGNPDPVPFRHLLAGTA
jgi:hypothetical protein